MRLKNGLGLRGLLIKAHLFNTELYMIFKWLKFFKRGKSSQKEKEKQEILDRVVRCYTHELRSPLVAIKAGMDGIYDHIPALIQSYKLAANAGVPRLPEIPQASLDLMLLVLDNIQRDLENMHFFLKTKALCFKEIDIAKISLQNCSIKKILENALRNFSNKSKSNENCFYFSPSSQDFHAKVNAELLGNLFLIFVDELASLFKSANEPTRIQIKSYVRGDKNHLIFIVSGMKISADRLLHLFNPWTVSSLQSLGIELFFCKKTMAYFDGDLCCFEDDGKIFFDFSFSTTNNKEEVI